MNTTEQNGGPATGNPPGAPPGGNPPDNGGGMKPEANWTSGLQEAENREFIVKKGWDKPESGADVVIRSYRELEGRLGRSIILPTADSPKEDHDKLYTALGKPAKPDGYQFKLPEGVSDNFPYDDTFATEFKGWAHAADLNPRQAQALHDNFVKRAAKQLDDGAAATKAKVAVAHQAIQEKWGVEGTVGYKRQLELAGRALRKLGLVDSYKAVGLITTDGTITDAPTAFALAEIGAAMYAEDSVHGQPGHLTQSNPWKEGQENLSEQGRILKANPDQARALITAAGKDPDKVLFKPR